MEFACGFNDFVQAVQNPDEYPSLQYQVMEVNLYLDDWWLVFFFFLVKLVARV